jgi:hypothetical protein
MSSVLEIPASTDNILLDESALARLAELIGALTRGHSSVVIAAQDMGWLQHHALALTHALREHGDVELSVQPFAPMDTLLERFNALVSDLRVREARHNGKSQAPAHVWLMQSAEQYSAESLQVLQRILHDFPGAKLQLAFILHGELSRSPLTHWPNLWCWPLSPLGASQAQALVQRAGLYGWAREAEAWVARCDVSSAPESAKRKPPSQASASQDDETSAAATVPSTGRRRAWWLGLGGLSLVGSAAAMVWWQQQTRIDLSTPPAKVTPVAAKDTAPSAQTTDTSGASAASTQASTNDAPTTPEDPAASDQTVALANTKDTTMASDSNAAETTNAGATENADAAAIDSPAEAPAAPPSPPMLSAIAVQAQPDLEAAKAAAREAAAREAAAREAAAREAAAKEAAAKEAAAREAAAKEAAAKEAAAREAAAKEAAAREAAAREAAAREAAAREAAAREAAAREAAAREAAAREAAAREAAAREAAAREAAAREAAAREAAAREAAAREAAAREAAAREAAAKEAAAKEATERAAAQALSSVQASATQTSTNVVRGVSIEAQEVASFTTPQAAVRSKRDVALMPMPAAAQRSQAAWIQALPANSWVVQHALLATREAAALWAGSNRGTERARILVLPGSQGDSPSYAVVTGPFPNEAAAQAFANDGGDSTPPVLVPAAALQEQAP